METPWSHYVIHQLMYIAYAWMVNNGRTDEHGEIKDYESMELYTKFRLANAFRNRQRRW